MLQNVLLDKEAQRLVASLHGIRIITGLLQATDLVLLTRATGVPQLGLVAQMHRSSPDIFDMFC